MQLCKPKLCCHVLFSEKWLSAGNPLKQAILVQQTENYPTMAKKKKEMKNHDHNHFVNNDMIDNGFWNNVTVKLFLSVKISSQWTFLNLKNIHVDWSKPAAVSLSLDGDKSHSCTGKECVVFTTKQMYDCKTERRRNRNFIFIIIILVCIMLGRQNCNWKIII